METSKIFYVSLWGYTFFIITLPLKNRHTVAPPNFRKENKMFNWIKNLFCRPQEQYCSVFHIVYEIEKEEPVCVKPKRKYTKRGKNKIKKKGKK